MAAKNAYVQMDKMVPTASIIFPSCFPKVLAYGATTSLFRSLCIKRLLADFLRSGVPRKRYNDVSSIWNIAEALGQQPSYVHIQI